MGSWVRALEEGTKETFSKTIRALFQQASPSGWNNDNVSDIDPTFLSDEDMTSGQIYTEAGEGVLFEEGNSRWINTALDNSQGDKEQDVIITVFAPNKLILDLMRDEVERVLRQNNPGKGTVLLKSNGTDDSPILGWQLPLPEWINYELGLNKPERSAKSQMILRVRYQSNWQ